MQLIQMIQEITNQLDLSGGNTKMNTITREEQLKEDTLLHFAREQEDAAKLWDHIKNDTRPGDEDTHLVQDDQRHHGHDHRERILWCDQR